MKLKLIIIFNLWQASCSLASDSVRETIAATKKFACSYCDYVASKKSSLTVHIRTHTGEKPFACSYCDYAAIQKSSLTVHTRTHTGEKPFACSHCDYATNYKSTLTKHEMTHKKRKRKTSQEPKLVAHGGAGYEEDFGEDPDQLESLLDLTKIHNVAAEIPGHWSDGEIE